VPRQRRSREQWVALGREALLALLDREHAVVWDEAEAKLSDVAPPAVHVDPHHLTTAKLLLLDEGIIAEATERTRGGRSIGVFHRIDVSGRATAIAKASARKRLLHARYLRWTTGDKSTAAIIGRAGEESLHNSIRAAAPAAGYRLVRPDGGQVRSLFDDDIPGGPLDHAAYLATVLDNGHPGETVLVPIEVKNRRGWIYPNSSQLYQLLYKAAALQEAHPETGIVPLLVCRRHAHTARVMAGELGFVVIQAKAQFIAYPSDAAQEHLTQVRNELGYDDLTTDLGPHPRTVGALERVLPQIALRQSERWAHFGPALLDEFQVLRRDNIPQPHRTYLMAALRESVRRLGGEVAW
jgi:hypothetical protein